MRSFWLILVLTLSCAESDSDPAPDLEIIQSVIETDSFNESRSEDWVCYHPDSEFHNQKCVEDEYPLGCYVSGDQGRFCWLLQRDDCSGTPAESLLEVCKNLGFR